MHWVVGELQLGVPATTLSVTVLLFAHVQIQVARHGHVDRLRGFRTTRGPLVNIVE